MRQSQSPLIGAMFLSYFKGEITMKIAKSQSPLIGAMFLSKPEDIPLDECYASQSPLIGAMFLRYDEGGFNADHAFVSIPSNRGNVSKWTLHGKSRTVHNSLNPL